MWLCASQEMGRTGLPSWGVFCGVLLGESESREAGLAAEGR